jgi:hypothetical protein
MIGWRRFPKAVRAAIRQTLAIPREPNPYIAPRTVGAFGTFATKQAAPGILVVFAPWRSIAFNGKRAKPFLVMICDALGEYGQCSAARRRYSRLVNCNFYSRKLGYGSGKGRLAWIRKLLEGFELQSSLCHVANAGQNIGR